MVVAALLVAYGVITGVDTFLTIGRMWETPAVRPYEEPLLMMQKGIVPFDGGEAFYREADGRTLESPLQKSDSRTLTSGKTLYFTYCAQCHGKYHDGNGTVGQSFHPLPSDLRSEKVQTSPEGVLFKEIS